MTTIRMFHRLANALLLATLVNIVASQFTVVYATSEQGSIAAGQSEAYSVPLELEDAIAKGGAQAETAFRSASEQVERTHSKRSWQYLHLLRLRARGLENSLDFAGSERAHLEALHLAQARPKEADGYSDSPNAIWRRLISIQLAQGKFEHAWSSMEARFRSADINRATHPWEFEDALTQKAGILESRGEYAQALAVAKHRLSLVGEIKRTDAQLMRPLRAIASIYSITGDYVSALPYAKHALDISQEEFAKERYRTSRSDIAYSVNVYAIALEGLGQSALAESLLLRVSQLLDDIHIPLLRSGLKLSDGDHIEAKEYLAFFYQRQRRYDRMLEVALRRKQLLEEWGAGQASALIELDIARGLMGFALCQLGRHAEAKVELDVFDQTLARTGLQGMLERMPAAALSVQERATCALRADNFIETLRWARIAIGSRAIRLDGSLHSDAPLARTVPRDGLAELSLLHVRYKLDARSFGEEEFAAAQLVHLTSTDGAISRSVARTYAASRRQLPLVEEYERTEGELADTDARTLDAIGTATRARLDRAAIFSAAYRRNPSGGTEARTPQERFEANEALERELNANKLLKGMRTLRDTSQAALEVRRVAVERALPDYFGKLRGDLVTLARLRATTGRDALLLREDEALILIVPGASSMPADYRGGFVLVVTKDHPPRWAPLGIEPEVLSSAVSHMHQELDGKGATRPAGMIDPNGQWGPRGFDRTRSKALNDALFSHPDISEVLQAKERWILIPQGRLLSLPFAALVTADPPGGTRGDSDPEMLRKTRWLGLEKTLSLLPSVTSLLALRSSAAEHRRISRVRFFGIGEPEFRGTNRESQPMEEGVVRNGIVDPAGILALPHLKNPELRFLASAIGGSSAKLLLGLNATEGKLRAVAERVRDADIVVFATHGLKASSVAGGLNEPALVLMPPAGGVPPLPADDDGLLKASEITQLRLAAEWVVLSACNSASGDRSGEGLSGLARAFLSAGSRSLLVAQWGIRNDVATRVVLHTVLSASKPKQSKAVALRSAMRVLSRDVSNDTTGHSYAHPSAWAALQFVGIDGN